MCRLTWKYEAFRHIWDTDLLKGEFEDCLFRLFYALGWFTQQVYCRRRDPLIRLYMSFGSILVIFTEINKSNLITILFHKILEWDNNAFLLLNNISQNIHLAMLSIELLLYHSFWTANHYLSVYQASQLKSFQSCISCNCRHYD